MSRVMGHVTIYIYIYRDLFICLQLFWFFLFWYWCYYQHTSRDSVSPICGIFTDLALLGLWERCGHQIRVNNGTKKILNYISMWGEGPTFCWNFMHPGCPSVTNGLSIRSLRIFAFPCSILFGISLFDFLFFLYIIYIYIFSSLKLLSFNFSFYIPYDYNTLSLFCCCCYFATLLFDESAPWLI